MYRYGRRSKQRWRSDLHRQRQAHAGPDFFLPSANWLPRWRLSPTISILNNNLIGLWVWCQNPCGPDILTPELHGGRQLPSRALLGRASPHRDGTRISAPGGVPTVLLLIRPPLSMLGRAAPRAFVASELDRGEGPIITWTAHAWALTAAADTKQ